MAVRQGWLFISYESHCVEHRYLAWARSKKVFRYSQSGEINVDVDDTATAIQNIANGFTDQQQDRLDGLTVDCGDWWFNVRPSNTEPLLRLNVEGPDVTEVAKRVDQILDLIH